MNVQHAQLQGDAVAVRQAHSADDFGLIRAAGCGAVLWPRDLPKAFQPWIDALAPANLPVARLTLRPEAVPDTLAHLFDIAGLEEGAQSRWFADDIAHLATQFAALMKAPYLRLRLDAVTTNACSKFHVDAMLARLICTYRGSGTQYGMADAGAEPPQISQAPTGAPMILRGTLWPQDPPSGLRHRSPPIAGTGETRLVLVLDPIYDIEDAD
ncbi:MAG: DUF1826 domain-containing protein [Pseudomonadota bacterium]